MLRVLSGAEQRYRAVLRVICDGATLTEVAARFGSRTGVGLVGHVLAAVLSARAFSASFIA